MPLFRNDALNTHYSAGVSVVFFVVFFGSSTTGSATTSGAGVSFGASVTSGDTGCGVFHGADHVAM
jgi:hypothetical protein